MATRNAETRMMPDREYDKHLLIHRHKMQMMKSNLDNQPSPQYPHLSLGLKRLKTEEQKNAETDRENKLLLKRMTAIMTSRGDYQDHDEIKRRSRSLNVEKRQREHDRVKADNIYIAHKIERTKPFYSVDKWEKSYRDQQRYLEMMSRGKTKGSSPGRSPRPKKRSKQAYASDFESESDVDQREDETKKRDKLPPIKNGHEKKPHPPASPRVQPDTARSERGQRNQSPDKKEHRSPDPELWMYYGIRPGDPGDKSDFYHQGKNDEKKGKGQGTKNSKADKERKEAIERQREIDCMQLFKVARDLEPVNEVLIKTLAKKSFKQRMKTKDRYNELCGQDLEQDLKKRLGSDWNLLLDNLFTDQNTGQSEGASKSLKNDDPVAFVKKVTPLNNKQLLDLKKEYKKRTLKQPGKRHLQDVQESCKEISFSSDHRWQDGEIVCK